MKTTNKIHYVYKITNLNPTDERLYYIGVRSTSKASAALDTNYRSSSKPLKAVIKEIGYNNFSKEILSEWATRKLANQEEVRLHEEFNVAKNKQYYNKAKATSNGFCTEGHVSILDIRDNSTKSVTVQELKSNEFYVSVSKNKMTILDTKDNETKRINSSDYDNNRYLALSHNKVGVIDSRDNTSKRVSIHDYYNTECYISPSKGLVTVKSKDKFIRVTKNEYKNGEYKMAMSGMVTVRDNDAIINVSVEDYATNKNYKHITSDTVSVIDNRDNTHKRVSKSDYKLFDYYISFMSNKVSVIDIRDNKTKQISKSEFVSDDFYVSVNSKKYKIFDKDNNLIYNVYGAFGKFCKSNDLPYSLSTSHRNNGSPIYQITNRIPPKYKEYQGWYAIQV